MVHTAAPRGGNIFYTGFFFVFYKCSFFLLHIFSQYFSFSTNPGNDDIGGMFNLSLPEVLNVLNTPHSVTNDGERQLFKKYLQSRCLEVRQTYSASAYRSRQAIMTSVTFDPEYNPWISLNMFHKPREMNRV